MSSSSYLGATIVVDQEAESGVWRATLSTPVTDTSAINEREAKERLATKLEAIAQGLRR